VARRPLVDKTLLARPGDHHLRQLVPDADATVIRVTSGAGVIVVASAYVSDRHGASGTFLGGGRRQFRWASRHQPLRGRAPRAAA
jgi:hypothetical protein